MTCARPSARRSSAPPRRRCRTGSRTTSRAPAASSSAAPRPTSATRSASCSADPNADRSKPAVAAGARAGPPAALRRALDAGGGGREASTCKGGQRIDPRRAARRPRPAAVDLFEPRPRAGSRSNDVDLRQCDRGPRPETRKASQDGTRVELRIRPTVQGAAVVLENRTGRILAMVGGFSYPLSQLNRVTQARRQPGSSFKPMIYLAALSAAACSPTRWSNDAPITLPPIGGAPPRLRARLQGLVVAAATTTAATPAR